MNFDAHTFQKLYDIIAKLRAPDGCPWDQKQTPQTLREFLIEETYECVEAIDENEPAHIKEELGDLFLLALMLSYVHQEAGLFSVNDVLNGVSEKLIRRHPHVFGDQKVKDSDEVLYNWAKIKVEQEGRKPKDSIMDEVSLSLPPLERAHKLQAKASKAGFEWDTVEGVFLKIEEEIGEIKSARNEKELEEELGDLIFSVANLCNYLKINPSLALQKTNNKFIKRFKHVEKKMQESGRKMCKENIDIMEEFWTDAKDAEIEKER